MWSTSESQSSIVIQTAAKKWVQIDKEELKYRSESWSLQIALLNGDASRLNEILMEIEKILDRAGSIQKSFLLSKKVLWLECKLLE